MTGKRQRSSAEIKAPFAGGHSGPADGCATFTDGVALIQGRISGQTPARHFRSGVNVLRIAENFGSDFMFGPPVADQFTVLNVDQAGLLVRRLEESDFDGRGLKVEAVRILPLPFYPGWLLVDLQATPAEAGDSSSEDEQPSLFEDRGIHSFLYGPDGFTPLTGTSLVLHHHNSRFGIELATPEQREFYLRFFCYFVRGSDGPFEIVDRSDQLDLSNAEIDQEFVIRKPVLSELHGENSIVAYDVFVLYGDKIFNAIIEMEAGGMVRMRDETHLASGASRIPPLHYQSTLRYPAPPPDWD